jgi:ankyrin repeat protein
VTDKNGTTALHYAANLRLYKIAELLMTYHANVELTDIRKKTAFDYAVIANDDKLIQILKSK